VNSIQWQSGKKRSDYDDFRVSEESNGVLDGSLKHWPEVVGDGGWVSEKMHWQICHHRCIQIDQLQKGIDFHQGTSCLPSTILRSSVLGSSVCQLRSGYWECDCKVLQ
jgi:hypothetical protein